LLTSEHTRAYHRKVVGSSPVIEGNFRPDRAIIQEGWPRNGVMPRNFQCLCVQQSGPSSSPLMVALRKVALVYELKVDSRYIRDGDV
jgi:hypothetical protein